MKIKIYILLIAFTTLLSCKKDKALVFTTENITEKYQGECKSENCSEVILEYIKVKGNKTVSEKINTSIHNFIIKSLQIDEDESSNNETIADAANKFLSIYDKDKAEFPDIVSEYFAEISVAQTYTSKLLLSFEQQQYLFTGGAHGYGSISFLNIDPSSGDILNNNDIIINENEFLDFVEKKFRIEYEITEKESINSSGFWFENDVFYLPKTLGFNKDEIIILYNPYEIASYAAGPIALTIPLNEALPFLTIE